MYWVAWRRSRRRWRWWWVIGATSADVESLVVATMVVDRSDELGEGDGEGEGWEREEVALGAEGGGGGGEEAVGLGWRAVGWDERVEVARSYKSNH